MSNVSSTTGALWMPFTSAGGSRPPVVVAGDGNYVVTDDGSRLLDATAGGVACVILGQGRSEIADAVAEQLRTLEYHCLFGYSHPRAQRAGRGGGRPHSWRSEPRVLHQLRLRGGGDRPEDGPRVLAPGRPRSQDRVRVVAPGVPRHELRRNLGGRPDGEPGWVWPAAGRLHPSSGP